MAGKPKRPAKCKGDSMTAEGLPVRSFFTQGTHLSAVHLDLSRKMLFVRVKKVFYTIFHVL